MWGLASYEGEEDPEDWGRWNHCPCLRRSREWSRRYLSLLQCCGGFVSQALSLLVHPFLTVVFHILWVFPPTAVCLSQRVWVRVVGGESWVRCVSQ